MPNVLPKDALESADAAVQFARLVRKSHARRTAKSSKQRLDDIERALERLHDAMGPLRSEIGRFPYGPQNPIAEANREEIREASLAIQSERRKLWKLRKKDSK